ncbi:hypothetical protein ESZ53_01565 [Salinibacterium sp. UTAS2018]|uniref:hypothetical protein n=1 Tax=unclassified Salinibacterium TaxID=2632331 RepID=UPI0010096DE2|nr:MULTISPECIES: hypothetical protein [unclassified Salinibacterium]MBH0009561.1 hypothetical protein [Salinibacterium sp. SWN1162]QAV69244.1 hypothetical protein ESZ53_01565 [Salinibacterium sp. UTAS2018]
MTMPRTPFALTPLSAVRRVRVAAVVLAITATLAACSTSTDDDLTDTGTTDDSSTAEETAGDEAAPDEPAAGGLTSDDVGNATVIVNGVEFPDFTGDCEISRLGGKEDVGDLSMPGIFTIVGIDNVKAHEDEAMNFVAINESQFRFNDLVGAAGVETPARGDIASLTELGSRTADGSRDLVEVRFAGTFEDGTPIEVDIVCELQNAF